MPLYEYVCKKCKKEFEVSCSFSDKIGTKLFCPSCKSKEVIKKVSLPNFILKGNDYYKNNQG